MFAAAGTGGGGPPRPPRAFARREPSRPAGMTPATRGRTRSGRDPDGVREGVGRAEAGQSERGSAAAARSALKRSGVAGAARPKCCHAAPVAERVFVNRNAESALKLGQARGAALVAVPDIPVFEYAATRVKQATTGNGKASKRQVQHMVRVLLALPEAPPADEADALAVALCHAHSRDHLRRMRPDRHP